MLGVLAQASAETELVAVLAGNGALGVIGAIFYTAHQRRERRPNGGYSRKDLADAIRDGDRRIYNKLESLHQEDQKAHRYLAAGLAGIAMSFAAFFVWVKDRLR